MTADKKRIGIMGGTFNPIHMGHLLLAETAYSEFHLDTVWFMPAAGPPHKTGQYVIPYQDRARMTELAIENVDYFLKSDFETEREGYSYTSETLRLLRENYPECEFFFIMGADSLFQIETWHLPEKVLAQATILAAGREHYPSEKLSAQIDYLKGKYNAGIFLLHIPEIDISSALIRRKASEGSSVRFMVPEKVYHYINEHRLYSQIRESVHHDE